MAALLTCRLLNAAAPVPLSVLTMAAFPPAIPKVPLSGPLNDPVAVYVLPV